MHYSLGCQFAFEKLGISRLDKEVAKGRVDYSDVVPGATSRDQTGYWHKAKGDWHSTSGDTGLVTRIAPVNTSEAINRRIRFGYDPNKATAQEALMAPAPVSPDRLARTRALNDALYKAQLKNPQAATGLPSIEAHSKFSPIGPGMVNGQVYVPPESASLIRGVANKEKVRPTLSILAGNLPPGNIFTHPQVASRLHGPSDPMDPTLNKAILQHEFGEANMFHNLSNNNGKIQPLASHLGAEPILRENLGTLGDPAAQNMMAKARTLDRGDVSVQQAIRQVGGTPNSPVPLGGKQHRAVERILNKRISADPQAAGAGFGKALQIHFAAGENPQLGYKMPPEAAKLNLPALTEQYGPSVERINKAMQTRDYPQVTKTLREQAPHLKETFSNLMRLSKRLRP